MCSKSRILLLVLSVFLILEILAGCGKEKMPEQNESLSVSESLSQEEDTVKISKLTVNGTDISEYRIVYATSFAREQCYENFVPAAEKLSDVIYELYGIRLLSVPDTKQTVRNEIILGIATRSECIRYYEESTKLEADDYCVMYSGGKILLGADCLAGVMSACDRFTEYLRAEAVNSGGQVNIEENFDISGEKHIPRIVCVGDSITQGIGVDNEPLCSYPSILQKELGYSYDVVNYGRSGATMCSYAVNGYTQRSYIDKSGYYDDLIKNAAKIDIVIIMLGTNDGGSSAEINDLLSNNFVAFKTDFKLNLTKMVKELREKNDNIEIIMFNAPKCYRTGNSWESNLSEYIRPYQKQVAQELEIGFYDMYAFSSSKMNVSDFSDGLHPNIAGYEKLGAEAAKALREVLKIN